MSEEDKIDLVAAILAAGMVATQQGRKSTYAVTAFREIKRKLLDTGGLTAADPSEAEADLSKVSPPAMAGRG
jgi:hypothetical protein